MSYKKLSSIGSGSFSKVFLATDGNGNKVAMKISPKSDLTATANILTGRNALEIIRQSDREEKKFIISYIDFIESDTEVCLVLEYIPGGELFDYVSSHKKGIELHTVKQIIHDLLEAIAFIHSLGIAHGDIKLENILIYDSSPHIKLIDFGLAETRATIDKEPKGSSLYFAPEAIMNLPRSPFKCDVWACGVIAFILLTQRMPFDSALTTTLARTIAMGDYDWREDQVSKEGKDFVDKMLNRNPELRPTAEDLLQCEYMQL